MERYLDSVDISTRNETESNKHFKVVDLFCGCGGLSCGFQDAGFELVGAVEFDKHASETYQANFSHPIVTNDITLPETKDELYSIVNDSLVDGECLDVLCGGFPCQSFSMSGKRLDDDPRNYLYKDFVMIAERLQPKVIVGENVEGILTKHGGKDVQDIVRSFENIGYDITFHLLSATDYGVPQERKRVIFIGNRMGAMNAFPLPLLTSKFYVTVNDAISDLAKWPEDATFSQIYSHHDLEMMERMASVAQGCTLYPSRHDSWKRLDGNKPAFTMKHNNGAPAIHPVENRVITPREMARLQSFPDDFMFVGAKKYQYMQIGNAVPPLMAKAVALAVRQMLECGF